MERCLIGAYCGSFPAPCQDGTANEAGSSCSCSTCNNNGIVRGSTKPPARQPSLPAHTDTYPAPPLLLGSRRAYSKGIFFACLFPARAKTRRCFPRRARGGWQSRIPRSPRCLLPARGPREQKQSPDGDRLPFPPLLRVTGPGASLPPRASQGDFHPDRSSTTSKSKDTAARHREEREFNASPTKQGQGSCAYKAPFHTGTGTPMA